MRIGYLTLQEMTDVFEGLFEQPNYDNTTARGSEPNVVENVPDTCNNSVPIVPMDIDITAQQSELEISLMW